MTDRQFVLGETELRALMIRAMESQAWHSTAALMPHAMRGVDRLLASLSERAQEAESPILAFQAWAERRAPMTQDQYFLAQEAFFAAHPGKGPTSSTMEAESAQESPLRRDILKEARQWIDQIYSLYVDQDPNRTDRRKMVDQLVQVVDGALSTHAAERGILPLRDMVCSLRMRVLQLEAIIGRD